MHNTIILCVDESMLWSCPRIRSLGTAFIWESFKVITDHQALTHLYYMQDNSNMLLAGLSHFKTSTLHLD